MKPICVPCQQFYRPKKNGFRFIEGMPVDNARPGKVDADKWSPYKLWNGDLWECRGCGHQIISGVGHSPESEHYKDDFAKRATGVTYQVNDC